VKKNVQHDPLGRYALSGCLSDSSTHATAAKRKSWSYSGRRVKRWKEKNGVGVFTVIPLDIAQAIKREALAHKKPQWKLLRACIQYGFQVAMRRGF
jgi:hypothetical protein